MSGLLPFAPESHRVWSRFAADIHATVWDRVGVEKVREFVRCWGATLKRGPLSPAWDAWETAGRGVKDPDRVTAEVTEHWGDSLEVDEEERRQLLPPSIPDRPDESTPSDLRLPLPLSHDRRSTEEKWATLAAIHDAYWLDADKINPFPEPANQQDLKAGTAWVTAGGFVYRQLLEQVLKSADIDLKRAKSEQRVLNRWLKEVAGEDDKCHDVSAVQPQAAATPTPETEQSEGTGAAASPPAKNKSPCRKVKPSESRAYTQWREAVKQNAELDGADDDVVYGWLAESGDAKLPRRDTWKRQLRNARCAVGEQKHRPRAGREHGKSIVRPDDI